MLPKAQLGHETRHRRTPQVGFCREDARDVSSRLLGFPEENSFHLLDIRISPFPGIRHYTLHTTSHIPTNIKPLFFAVNSFHRAQSTEHRAPPPGVAGQTHPPTYTEKRHPPIHSITSIHPSVCLCVGPSSTYTYPSIHLVIYSICRPPSPTQHSPQRAASHDTTAITLLPSRHRSTSRAIAIATIS